MGIYRGLDRGLKAQVKAAVIKLSKDPNTRGLRFKPLEGSSGFWSIRVNDNFRILIRVSEDADGPFYFVVNAGNHDIYDR
jgi:plasmid maintenance system killer protein